MRPSAENIPWIIRHLTGDWHWHHARFFVGMELVVPAWMVTIGVILCASGYWEGALVFVGVALLLWFILLFERAVWHREA